MRKAQISIKLTLIENQAANSNGALEIVTAYADSNNIYETICAGFKELFAALEEQGRQLPSLGVAEYRINPWTQ